MTSHPAAGGGNLGYRRADRCRRERRVARSRRPGHETTAEETLVASTQRGAAQPPRLLTACILIASKDGEATIGHAIEHCRGQADVYVVSDGSTDRTVAEAKRCGATVMALADNVGKPNALRMAYDGFRLGRRYDAILVLDDDTRLAPDFIDEAMTLMQPGVAVVCGRDAVRLDVRPALEWTRRQPRLRLLALRPVPQGGPTGDQRDHRHPGIELRVPHRRDDRTPGTRGPLHRRRHPVAARHPDREDGPCGLPALCPCLRPGPDHAGRLVHPDPALAPRVDAGNPGTPDRADVVVVLRGVLHADSRLAHLRTGLAGAARLGVLARRRNRPPRPGRRCLRGWLRHLEHRRSDRAQ